MNQEERLQGLLRKIAGGAEDSYYTRVLADAGLSPGCSIEEFATRCPLTDKAQLVEDREAHPPFGSMLTEPQEAYTRFCQTSGTSGGRPMPVVDTAESWEAMLGAWRHVYEAAGLVPGRDRLFFAFSFGPFLGFWTAFDAAASDFLSIPGGGFSSRGRLEAMEAYGVSVLCCTPTYAIRLGEVLAESEDFSIEDFAVHTVIVAGEPGGSLPSTRARIAELWGGARTFDHHGLTETGPVTYEHPEEGRGLVVMEDAFLAEVVDPDSGQSLDLPAEGELVLTTLARTASPLLRYRTGDLVDAARDEEGRFVLEGGILGRCDDMVVVRGVNIYPSAVEEVLRAFPEMIEFQVVEKTEDAMAELEVRVELEPSADTTAIVAAMEGRLRDRFLMRLPVSAIPEGEELPRFEFKAKRWVKG